MITILMTIKNFPKSAERVVKKQRCGEGWKSKKRKQISSKSTIQEKKR